MTAVSGTTKDASEVLSTFECLLVGEEAGQLSSPPSEVRLATGQLGLGVVVGDQALAQGAHGVPLGVVLSFSS